MDLVYSIAKGLHEVPEIEELKWQDGEYFDAWLKRLGYTDVTVKTPTDEVGTAYAIYQRQSDVYPYVAELSHWDGSQNIYCQTMADVIGLRAFLAPIILAEHGVRLDLNSSIDTIVTYLRDDRVVLDEKSRFGQLLVDAVDRCR